MVFYLFYDTVLVTKVWEFSISYRPIKEVVPLVTVIESCFSIQSFKLKIADILEDLIIICVNMIICINQLYIFTTLLKTPYGLLYLWNPNGYEADSLYHIIYLWCGDLFFGKSYQTRERWWNWITSKSSTFSSTLRSSVTKQSLTGQSRKGVVPQQNPYLVDP